MTVNPIFRDRKQIVWPVAGLTAGFLVGIQPLGRSIALETAIAVLCVTMGMVLFLSVHPVGARIGALLSGLLLAVPCFVRAEPLQRGLLMCSMAGPFVAAAALVLVPPIPGLRPRVAYLLAWEGTREVTRRACSFDVGSLFHLILATVIFAAAIAAVKAIPASGLWLPARWFTGGILIFAFAEMATAGLPLVSAAFGLTVPQLMQSPWRSASVSEFWTKRWNIFASQKIFRPYIYAPLARWSAAVALFSTFFVSGLAHSLLAFMAIGKWGISLCCGAFFVIQPLLIAVERRMKVRRWPPVAAQAWTLTALAITSPLFVEPALQIAANSWGGPNTVVQPTAAALGFVMVLCGAICGSIAFSWPAQVEDDVDGDRPGAARGAVQ